MDFSSSIPTGIIKKTHEGKPYLQILIHDQELDFKIINPDLPFILWNLLETEVTDAKYTLKCKDEKEICIGDGYICFRGNNRSLGIPYEHSGPMFKVFLYEYGGWLEKTKDF